MLRQMQEPFELFGCPHSVGPTRARLIFGSVGGFGQVGPDKTTAEGIVERGSDNYVNIEDSLGCESLSGPCIAMIQQVGVQLLQPFGA